MWHDHVQFTTTDMKPNRSKIWKILQTLWETTTVKVLSPTALRILEHYCRIIAQFYILISTHQKSDKQWLYNEVFFFCCTPRNFTLFPEGKFAATELNTTHLWKLSGVGCGRLFGFWGGGRGNNLQLFQWPDVKNYEKSNNYARMFFIGTKKKNSKTFLRLWWKNKTYVMYACLCVWWWWWWW